MCNANLDYSWLSNNSPASSDNLPELAEQISKLEQMHEDIRSEFEGFSSPRKILTHPNKINHRYLANKEANVAEKIQDNGAMPPISTHPSLSPSTPIDTPESPD